MAETPTDWHLENTYVTLPKVFYSEQQPIPVKNPVLVYFNTPLAMDLGLGFLEPSNQNSIEIFSGNRLPPNSQPLAQAYAGHQFGYFNMLGDGRAILLGEQISPEGKRIDVQLKGAGQTPYSRRGDGRATLYSMLREYLISEAMHYLNIPTTRSLAVVTTGEYLVRESRHTGAVLTRTAQSHIRVGTFEFASYYGTKEDLQALTNYTISRHYPELRDSENPPLELLRVVLHQQIELIVHWMRVGFIHGVMNTDNMSIAGETIDYGPCAFMNAFDPKTVFSSIDTNGRYAFGNQPAIAQWNLAKFASALLPIISVDQDNAVKIATTVLEEFKDTYTNKWYRMMSNKLGIMEPTVQDRSVIDKLLSLIESHQADYTQLFLKLEQDSIKEDPIFMEEDFKNWHQNWKKTYVHDFKNKEALALMRSNNPRIIPRNHWVENALESAVDGQLNPMTTLLEQLSRPYEEHSKALQFENLPNRFDEQYQTFCGT